MNTKKIPYKWEEFSGSIELECLNKELPELNDSKDLENFLQNIFSGISKVEVRGWNKEHTEKTAVFEILTEYDISDKIPDIFSIKTKWNELSDLELRVFNLKEDEIFKLAQENKVELKEIKKIEY